MLQHRHKHSIKQTLLSFTTLTIVGIGLFLVLKPNIENEVTEGKEVDVEVEMSYKLPDPDLKNTTNYDQPPDQKTKSPNKYLVQPQNLPLYLVKDIIDGNTVTLEEDVRVRLIGIKAPDKDEEFGLEATDFLKNFIEGKEVYFQLDSQNPKDAFGRLRGIIYFDRKNVNIEILRRGYAHVFITVPSIVEYSDWDQYEDEAREALRGLWSGKETGL